MRTFDLNGPRCLITGGGVIRLERKTHLLNIDFVKQCNGDKRQSVEAADLSQYLEGCTRENCIDINNP